MSDYYTATGTPVSGAALQSAPIDAEFVAIETAMNKLPTITGNANKTIKVNSGATALTVSKVLITEPATSATLTIADGATLTATATATVSGTNTGNETATTVGTLITSATGKTTPVDADEVPLTDSAAAFALKKLTWANLKATLKAYFDTLYASITSFTYPVNTEQGLTQYYMPSLDGNFRDLYRSGWLPAWFNQQWGGAQWGNLPDGSFGSVATGNVQCDTQFAIGDVAGRSYGSTGFKVSETATYDAAQVRLYKTGNPAGNVTVRIYSDTAGAPGAALGSAATLSCKVIASKTDGEFYQITGLAAALTAGTQYHLVISLAVDAANYINWKVTSLSKYPFGYCNQGTATPTWSALSGYAACFLIQNPAANSLLQTGGMFDYKLAFAAGTPANQSRSLAQPLSNFISGDDLTMMVRGTFVASTNVLDLVYGIDHDRITLTVNASGFPVLTVYRSDRTAATITGTVTCATGNHDIAFRVRLVGDGADYATLYDNGASVGTPLTAQTFTFANEFFTLGTARLGDGFGLAPTWTQDMQMASLPSAQGWTWAGTATEANAMSVAGGKLYQNANGYTSTQTGYYTKTVVLNNATGWCVEWKGRVVNDPNAQGSTPVGVNVFDGTKYTSIFIHEYFIGLYDAATVLNVQGDFKSQEHTFCLQGKGSDCYLFIDGKLAIDGTGKLLQTSATNAIQFGDEAASASANSDAIWSYVKYYQGGMILPVANTGTCSEFAHWSGDKTALLPYAWNAGTPVSIKQLCGVQKNYIDGRDAGVQKGAVRAVTVNPTTTSTAVAVVAPEMEQYAIGSVLSIAGWMSVANATATLGASLCVSIDGKNSPNAYTTSSTVDAINSLPVQDIFTRPIGLHKVELRWAALNGGTATLWNRELIAEARS